MREAQKRTKNQLTNLTEILTKFANQATINPPPSLQPSSSSPLPSQPLPNPKGGINMVRKERDEEEEENNWLYELLAELAKLDESDEEEDEEEEDETEEVVKEEDDDEAFFIATVYGGKKVEEEEIPVKCEDPGPCLVTCKIRGLEIPECMCDHGACGSVMPFELYETLDLGHKYSSCGQYYGKCFGKNGRIENSSSGDFIEIFHPTCPPAPQKKGAHQMQVCNEEAKGNGFLGEVEKKKIEDQEGKIKKGKGLRHAPPQVKKKKKKKKEPVKPVKKKKKHEEDEAKKKIELKCSSMGNLIDKLKIFKEALHNDNKKIDGHLVRENSKWK
ncbi:hypothetical protein PIB30_095198 [Stylosanthes scabra]|uniref:Uncharacterized protein n=1 Tax=Stylosanthes scabra TaxID=79078 RepID=A0ABU6YX09_9FABA|nr:hypothetical protein [Stylosanthes scabra]